MKNTCQNHQEKFENASYCVICSYDKENELLKERIEVLNEEMRKLYENRNP